MLNAKSESSNPELCEHCREKSFESAVQVSVKHHKCFRDSATEKIFSWRWRNLDYFYFEYTQVEVKDI